MRFVQFIFDLGDCFARFTGRIDAICGRDIKVVYFCPMAREYLTIDLTREAITDYWYSQAGILPLQPIVVEKR